MILRSSQTFKYGYDTLYDHLYGSFTNRMGSSTTPFGFDDFNDDKKNTVDIVTTKNGSQDLNATR